MFMAALALTAENFDEVISSGQLVFVDFWATWCRPCMMMGPIVDELAAEYDGRAIIAKTLFFSLRFVTSRKNIFTNK